MHQNIVTKRNKAFLVVVQIGQKNPTFLDESLQELTELTYSASIKIMGSLKAKLLAPKPSHFLREGKLTEVKDEAKKAGANVLIFNVELTPAQARNIEKFAGIPIMDRTGLILDIFGKRAKSKEGKLQVELARLNYILPRLGGLGGVMSRLGGGIGTRGPGEQELEWDRRKIRNRMKRVKEELKKVHKHRQLIRAGRKRRQFISVALVGYTNAGKSTLLNSVTGSDAYAKDKLFATLDPKTRMQSINGRRDILFVDTVGFLQDLPHSLIESFHATLEEVAEADLIIHILDAGHAKAEDYKKAVEDVLKELHADEIPILLALNKADLVDPEDRTRLQQKWPEGIWISALQKQGLNSLLAKLSNILELGDVKTTNASSRGQ